jgi:hypothetical protein
VLQEWLIESGHRSFDNDTSREGLSVRLIFLVQASRGISIRKDHKALLGYLVRYKAHRQLLHRRYDLLARITALFVAFGKVDGGKSK